MVCMGKTKKGRYQLCFAAWDRMHGGEKAKGMLQLVMDGTLWGISRVLSSPHFMVLQSNFGYSVVHLALNHSLLKITYGYWAFHFLSRCF